MEKIYQSLVARALQICQNKQRVTPSKRVIIALSGPPGAAKSTIAATVVARLNSLATRPFAISLPMDGFLYPRKYLDSLPNYEGAYPSHWSFDAAGVLLLVKALALSRTNEKEVIQAPEFDPVVGDPVEGAIVVSPDISLVFLEGNYSAYDPSSWSKDGCFIDDTWLVDEDIEMMKHRLAETDMQIEIEKTWGNATERKRCMNIPNDVETQTDVIQQAIVVRTVDGQ
ncbi:hypothetical protein BDV06DRAFT_234165 [Aspergillus oleicola]